MKLRTDGVTWQEIDGELVILDMQTSAYLTTNVAGAVLAKLLVQDREQQELSDALIAEFGIDRDTADRDAATFVDQLREKGLLA